MRQLGLVLGCWSAFLLAPTAGADADGAADYARVAVGASANLGYASGKSCPAAVSDRMSCPEGFLLAGLHLMPRWRGGEHWSLGLLGGLAMHTRRDSGPTDWWDAQAEARWHPWGAKPRDTWLGATAGAVLAIDRIPVHVVDVGPPHPAHTYVTPGPCGSVGIGFDGALASFLAIGVELRTVVFGLHTGQGMGSEPYYQPHVGGTLGMTITALGWRTR